MASDSYLKLLRDPRWQEMRLRVMDRDGFRCRRCCGKDSTLNVHHTYYQRGAAPWEYPTESLITVCEQCHKKAEVERRELQRWVGIANAACIDREVILFIRTKLALLGVGVDRVEVDDFADAAVVAGALGSEETMDSIMKRAAANGGSVSPLEIEIAAIEHWPEARLAEDDIFEDTRS